MKNTILLFLIFIFSLNLQSQDKLESKLKIGVSTSYDKNLANTIVNFSTNTGYLIDYNKVNYSFGLNLEYQLKSDIAISTGINYSNKDFTGVYFCHNCDFGFFPQPETVQFRFIEMPIAIKYYFLPNRLKLYTDVGVINHLKANREKYSKKYFVSAKLGGGLSYFVSKSLNIYLYSGYNVSFTEVFENSDYKLKTVSFGFGAALKI